MTCRWDVFQGKTDFNDLRTFSHYDFASFWYFFHLDVTKMLIMEMLAD